MKKIGIYVLAMVLSKVVFHDFKSKKKHIEEL